MKKIIVLVAAVAVLLATATEAPAKPVTVTVMTRNLFLGTDLIPIALADPGDPFERAVAKGYEDARNSHFEARARGIAREIAKARPDVVGLQEVTSWFTGTKNDPKPADRLAFEHLRPLLAELRRLHQPYRVVKGGGGIDLEGPSSLGFDVRITEDESLMLVRSGVRVLRHRARPFRHLLEVQTKALGPVTAVRSWGYVDVVKRGVRFRVVDTHLEAYSADVRLQQARELVAGPLKARTPVVLVGDLNSGPRLPKPEDRPPYDAIAAAGFAARRTPKPSCCFDNLSGAGRWDHNVDWIMAKPARRVRLVRSFLTGQTKLPEGVFASDHGGVVSVLRLG